MGVVTVAELVAALREFPQDARVAVAADNDGVEAELDVVDIVAGGEDYLLIRTT